MITTFGMGVRWMLGFIPTDVALASIMPCSGLKSFRSERRRDSPPTLMASILAFSVSFVHPFIINQKSIYTRPSLFIYVKVFGP